MDDRQRRDIEHDCERLCHRYSHVIDFGEAARVADLFHDGGVWKTPEAEHVGKPAILRAFTARQDNTRRMSRHVCSTVVIHVADADHASGVTYIQLYRHDAEPGRRVSPLADQPVIVGEYHDTFLRTPEGWRFDRREFRAAFVR